MNVEKKNLNINPNKNDDPYWSKIYAEMAHYINEIWVYGRQLNKSSHLNKLIKKINDNVDNIKIFDIDTQKYYDKKKYNEYVDFF